MSYQRTRYLYGNYSDHCERPTHSEHKVRAMLMGRVYDWRDGTYCKVFHGTQTGDIPMGDGELDYLNCEEMTDDEHVIRRGYGLLVPDRDWRVPTEPTPWARMG